MLIGPMLACNVVHGFAVGYKQDFQTFVPLVPDDVLHTNFYWWIKVYVKKIKQDLQCAGVWERALPCVASIHGVLVMRVWACKRTGIGHGRVGVQAYR